MNYFVFFPAGGGRVDSRELKIHIEELPDIQKPPKRVTKITVPGRSGTLTVEEGKYVYDAYQKTFEMVALDEKKIPEISELLDGSGKIIFSNEPQFRYTVSFDEGWSLSRFFKMWRRATISLETQPFKENVREKINRLEAENGSISATITGRTGIPCPFIADIRAAAGAEKVTVTVGGQTLEIQTKGKTNIQINGELELITADDGTNLLTGTAYNTFPLTFKPKENAVKITNATEAIFYHRGLYL